MSSEHENDETMRTEEDAPGAEQEKDVPYIEQGSKQCSICFDDPIDPSKEVRIPCGHSFCDSCIKLVVEQEDDFRYNLADLQDKDIQLLFSRRGRYMNWKHQRSFPCPLCRTMTPANNIERVATKEKLIRTTNVSGPRITTPFGESYHQLGGEGVASYHFESEDCCYIGYSNAHSSWTLGDGSMPPHRKMFVNVRYFEATRTFMGTIVWPEKFQGEGRWDYTIVFSPDFMIIQSGTLKCYKSALEPLGAPDELLHFNADLWYENSRRALTTIYGQVYLQIHAENVAAYHFPALPDAHSPEEAPWAPYVSYHDVGMTLDDGTNFPEKKYFVDPHYDPDTRTFTGQVHWSAPALCAGDSRWEYTMKFSEDFATIESGEVVNFAAEGGNRKNIKFGAFDPDKSYTEFTLFYRHKFEGEKVFE